MSYDITEKCEEAAVEFLKDALGHEEGWKYFTLDKFVSGKPREREKWEKSELSDMDEDEMWATIREAISTTRKGKFRVRVQRESDTQNSVVIRVERDESGGTGSKGRDLAAETMAKVLGTVVDPLGQRVEALAIQLANASTEAMDRVDDLRDKQEEERDDLQIRIMELEVENAILKCELQYQHDINALSGGWQAEDVIAIVASSVPLVVEAVKAINGKGDDNKLLKSAADTTKAAIESRDRRTKNNSETEKGRLQRKAQAADAVAAAKRKAAEAVKKTSRKVKKKPLPAPAPTPVPEPEPKPKPKPKPKRKARRKPKPDA